MNFSKWTKVENLPSAIAGENWLKMLGNCSVGDWNFGTSEYFELFAIFGNIPWIFWILRKYSNRTLFDRPHWPAFRGELSGGGFGKLETIEGREGLGLGAPFALRWARATRRKIGSTNSPTSSWTWGNFRLTKVGQWVRQGGFQNFLQYFSYLRQQKEKTLDWSSFHCLDLDFVRVSVLAFFKRQYSKAIFF